MEKEKEKENVKFCKQLVSETSAHGCRNFMSTERGKLMRFIWFGCVMGTTISLIITLYSVLQDYQTYPFNTVVKIGPKPFLHFPAITVCDMSYIHTDKFTNPTAVLSTFLARAPFSKFLEINETDEAYRKIANMPIDVAHSISNVSVKELFITCVWKQQFIPCDVIWSPVFTDLGICFVFNHNISNQYLADSPGSKGGLNFIARINQHGYIIQNANSAAGLKLNFHDPHENSRISEFGINVAPGAATRIGLKKRSYKFLSAPFKAYGDEYCIFNNNLKKENDQRYDRETCIRKCMINVVINNCSCKSVTESEVPFFPYCTIEKWLNCYIPTLDVLYTHNISDYGCDCPRTCDFNKYETRLSFGMFPSTPAIDILQQVNIIKHKSEAKTGYLDVNIFYEDLLLEEVSHVPVYSYTSIMGSVGGQMGLFLGASIITLAEIVEVILLFCWTRFLKLGSKIGTRRCKSPVVEPIKDIKK